MKLDWWKIRHVLLELRAGNALCPDAMMREHVLLCGEAGFIDRATITGPRLEDALGKPPGELNGELTWEGQEAAALLEDSDLLLRAHDESPCMAWDVLRPWLVRQLTPKTSSEGIGPYRIREVLKDTTGGGGAGDPMYVIESWR